MKNSRRSQIAVLIAVLISFNVFGEALWAQFYSQLNSTFLNILGVFILFVIPIGVILYYIALFEKKAIAITVSAVAIIFEILAFITSYELFMFLTFISIIAALLIAFIKSDKTAQQLQKENKPLYFGAALTATLIYGGALELWFSRQSWYKIFQTEYYDGVSNYLPVAFIVLGVGVMVLWAKISKNKIWIIMWLGIIAINSSSFRKIYVYARTYFHLTGTEGAYLNKYMTMLAMFVILLLCGLIFHFQLLEKLQKLNCIVTAFITAVIYSGIILCYSDLTKNLLFYRGKDAFYSKLFLSAFLLIALLSWWQLVESKNRVFEIASSIAAVLIDYIVLSYMGQRKFMINHDNLKWKVCVVGFILFILCALINLLICKEKKSVQCENIREKNSDAKPDTTTSSEIYCSLLKHILLLLFTFGIWNLIWIYRMTGYTNAAEGEEYRNPTKKLLLCMFVPFYSIYWTYKTAQRVDKMAAAKGVSSDMTTLCLILAIFVAIIPPILLQDVMNKIATADDTQPVSDQKAADVKETKIDTADEIKKFKELLDSGAITQEEFDAKKKQLLGL